MSGNQLSVLVHPLAAVGGDGVGRLQSLLRRFGDRVAAGPLFAPTSPERLHELVARAEEMDRTYDGSRLARWYRVVIDPDLDPDEVVAILERSELIEQVEREQVGKAATVVWTDDPKAAVEGHLDLAPKGIGAKAAWNVPGGDGTGVTVVHVEWGWKLDHADLAAQNVQLLFGAMLPDYYQTFHGTCALGELVMVDNTEGGVGIVPRATGAVAAPSVNGQTAWGACLVHLAGTLEFGDVIVITWGTSGTETPWETVPEVYDAVRLCTALGITVVESAGNTPTDLDLFTFSGVNIYDRNVRDSGAIIVGAGVPVTNDKEAYSAFGSRVDCFAWGDDVMTTAIKHDPNDPTIFLDDYNPYFRGTSSAAPIVAGAAVAVQGMAQATLGHRIGPLELRELLSTHGTPSTNPAVDKIGVMPDLAKLAGAIGAAPDLWMRDYVGDPGTPHTGPLSMSPDIIVRNSPVAGTPAAAFGPGSGTENDDTLSEDVHQGSDHVVYLRVLNKGAAAPDVTGTVYWSPPTTLMAPNLWTKIGTTAAMAVPGGNVLTVSDGIPWAEVDTPPLGHLCFVATIGSPDDPAPDATAFPTWGHFIEYIRRNNDVTWRNFDVVPMPKKGMIQLPFVVPGAWDEAHEFELQVIGGLPDGAKVHLDVPLSFGRRIQPRPRLWPIEPSRRRKVARGRHAIPVRPIGHQSVGRAMLPAGSVANCELVIEVPSPLERAHDFAIVQVFEGQEVGRLTRRFVPLR